MLSILLDPQALDHAISQLHRYESFVVELPDPTLYKAGLGIEAWKDLDVRKVRDLISDSIGRCHDRRRDNGEEFRGYVLEDFLAVRPYGGNMYNGAVIFVAVSRTY